MNTSRAFTFSSSRTPLPSFFFLSCNFCSFARSQNKAGPQAPILQYVLPYPLPTHMTSGDAAAAPRARGDGRAQPLPAPLPRAPPPRPVSAVAAAAAAALAGGGGVRRSQRPRGRPRKAAADDDFERYDEAYSAGSRY